MDGLIIGQQCTLCGKCLEVCPFDALELIDGRIQVNANCRLCRLCVKHCPEQAIRLQTSASVVDKSEWRGFMVFGEYGDGQLHPVTIELIGKARELAGKTKMAVSVVLVGHDLAQTADSLLDYGVNTVYVYDDPALATFRVDVYANVLTEIIGEMKPSVVLIGGTSLGRSLAPRVATRFRTGLTADCTQLDIKDNTDLIQIRPAFGGNIMAQIITTRTRPQFATVRYKVMDSAVKTVRTGKVISRNIPSDLLKSRLEVVRIEKKDALPSITEADVLVVAGQGVRSKDDLVLIRQLADRLGGQIASTRPMVEKGWLDYTRQIGLSGRTVKPKLIITCGVSGAIQFCACMNAADLIIAINRDPAAPIFRIAHYGIVGDLYNVIPKLIQRIEGSAQYAI